MLHNIKPLHAHVHTLTCQQVLLSQQHNQIVMPHKQCAGQTLSTQCEATIPNPTNPKTLHRHALQPTHQALQQRHPLLLRLPCSPRRSCIHHSLPAAAPPRSSP